MADNKEDNSHGNSSFSLIDISMEICKDEEKKSVIVEGGGTIENSRRPDGTTSEDTTSRKVYNVIRPSLYKFRFYIPKLLHFKDIDEFQGVFFLCEDTHLRIKNLEDGTDSSFFVLEYNGLILESNFMHLCTESPLVLVVGRKKFVSALKRQDHQTFKASVQSGEQYHPSVLNAEIDERLLSIQLNYGINYVFVDCISDLNDFVEDMSLYKPREYVPKVKRVRNKKEMVQNVMRTIPGIGSLSEKIADKYSSLEHLIKNIHNIENVDLGRNRIKEKQKERIIKALTEEENKSIY